jgi:glycosyltransferase involved in cell wall biosynthesis
MRIGLDLTCWANHRGYGRYTRNLVRALVATGDRHAYVGFADVATIREGAFPAGIELVAVPQSEAAEQAAAADGRRKLRDIWRMSRAVQRAGLDVMFFPTLYSYFPVLGRARCVVVVHDATPERWPGLVFPSLAGRLAWSAKSRLARWQARRVVTVSQDAAQSIHHYLGVALERLSVIPEAPDPVFRRLDTDAEKGQRQAVLERYRIPADAQLVLYVGGFSPHKDPGALIAAFAEVSDQDRPHLAMVGQTTGEVFYSCYPALLEQVRQLGLEEHVTFTGFVPDDDLVHLYQAATCLVLPSLDEGFGLPVAEAMACGMPVLATRAGALPELVGEAGLLVQPGEPHELTASLRRLLGDAELRAELRQRGLSRISEMSWERAAVKLLVVLEDGGPSLPATVVQRPPGVRHA